MLAVLVVAVDDVSGGGLGFGDVDGIGLSVQMESASSIVSALQLWQGDLPSTRK